MSVLKQFGALNMSRVIFVAALIFCFSGLLSYAGQQDKDKQLNDKVFSLIQQCDDTRSKDELLGIISEIEALTEQIEKGRHVKKKLYVIRLKKSRNMCQYLLHLREE